MTDQTPTFAVGTVPIHGELILAPLAGYSDQPYRSICRRMGSAMSYTEFVSAHGVMRGNERTLELLQFDSAERPVVFQVFGYDPVLLTEACLRLQDLGADIVDVNMGCPAARISGKGGGAGLLREPSRIAKIFAKLSKRLSVPVTGKIRLGWDQSSKNHVEIARILEDNGAALIAVHGRTRDETYNTPADWDAIAQVKQAYPNLQFSQLVKDDQDFFKWDLNVSWGVTPPPVDIAQPLFAYDFQDSVLASLPGQVHRPPIEPGRCRRPEQRGSSRLLLTTSNCLSLNSGKCCAKTEIPPFGGIQF